MTSRCHLRAIPRTGRGGNVVANAKVFVFLDEACTQPVADMFAAATGGSAITFVLTNSQGEAEAFLTASKPVWLKVTDNSGTAYYPSLPGEPKDFTDFVERVDVQPPPDFTGPTLKSDASNTGFGRNVLAALTSGLSNTAMGVSALVSATSGTSNTALGYAAGRDLTTGHSNTFAGSAAGLVVTTGYQNVLLGGSAGMDLTTGVNNTFVGHAAGQHCESGTSQVAVGRAALPFNIGGAYNVSMGHASGFGDVSGSFNVYIGDAAGSNDTSPSLSNISGDENVYIGVYAGPNGPDLNNAGAIGAYARVDVSNALVFGTASGARALKIGLGASTPLAKLDVRSHAANLVGLALRGAAAQSEHLQRWENSAGSLQAAVTAAGRIYASTVQLLTVADSYRSFSVNSWALYEGGTPNNLLIAADPAHLILALRAAAGQANDLAQSQASDGTPQWGLTAAGLPKWIAAGTVQTTVGAAGAASALPASPEAYFKVVHPDGRVLGVPGFLLN